MSQSGILSSQTQPSHIATQFPTDSGTAIPESNILNIFGGSGINTSASGDTITITAVGFGSLTFSTDSGNASPSSDVINLTGNSSQGVSSSGSGSTVTFTVADATTTSKGVSSFNASHFSVSSGAVSLVTPISVTYGGIGTTTLTQYAVLLGNDAGAITPVSGLGTSGQVLTSNGAAAAPTWQDNGDVVGPSSSTDHALVRWNGTTGKLVQNSTVIVDDTGNMTGVDSLNVGSRYDTSTPLTDGLLVEGKVSIGTDSPTTGQVTIASSIAKGSTAQNCLEIHYSSFSEVNGEHHGISLQPIFRPVDVVSYSHASGLYVSPTSLGANLYITDYYSIRSELTHFNATTTDNAYTVHITGPVASLGTITNAYSLYVTHPSTSGGSITSAYTAAIGEDNTARVGIGTNTPANVASIGGRTSIGASYVGTNAPTDGVIVEGDAGFGTSSPTSSVYITRSAVETSGARPYLEIAHVADTGITASTESPTVYFKLSAATRTWATGAITTQRFFYVDQPTIAFAGSSSVIDAATLSIAGAPIQGSNATITSSHGILISESSTANVTTGYGITTNAPAGATNSYSAQFLSERATNVIVHGSQSNAGSLEVVEILSKLTSTSNTTTLKGIDLQIKNVADTGITVTSATGLYVNSDYDENVGTITSGYGIYVDQGTTATGTLTNSYSLYLKTPQAGSNAYTAVLGDDSATLVGIGEGSPASMLSVAGNASVGSGYSTTAAPTDGLIIEGQVGIGTSSVTVDYVSIAPTIGSGSIVECVNIQPTFANDSASSYSAIDIRPSFSPTAAVTYANVYGLEIEMGVTPGAAATVTDVYGIELLCTSLVTNDITNAYGAYIEGIKSQSGTVQTAYALYLKTPYTIASGVITNAYTAILGDDNTALVGIGLNNPKSMLSVDGNCSIGSGYAGTAAPTDGLIVSGRIGIGKSSPSSKLHIEAATSSVASLIMDEGTLLSSPVSGAIEYDGADLYYTDNTNTRHPLAKSVGNVTGPGSSTDNAIARWNGTGGDTIQNSSVVIDDSDNVTGVTSLAIDGSSGNTLVVNTSDLVVNSTDNRVGVREASPDTTLHVTGESRGGDPTTTSLGDAVSVFENSNQWLEIGVTNTGNARRSWILSRHSTVASLGGYFCTLHLQPLITGTINDYEGVAIAIDPSNKLGATQGLAVGKSVSIGSSYATTSAPTNGLIVEGNVGIGETSPGSKLAVSGNASIGSSYDTTAAPTDGIIIEGVVGIGTSSPSTSSTKVHIYADYTGAGAQSNHWGLYSTVYQGGSGTITNNYSIYGIAEKNDTGNITNNYGARAKAVNNHTTGSITTNTGLHSAAEDKYSGVEFNYGAYLYGNNQASSGSTTTNYGAYIRASTLTSGGAITTNHGAYIYTSSVSGSTITTNYGLRIAEGHAGTVTNNWSLYNQSTADSYFAGDIGVGTTSITSGLAVPGTILKVDGTIVSDSIEVAGVAAQVLSTTKTDTFTTTNEISVGGAAVTGLSVTITPQTTSSKIYIICHLNVSGGSKLCAAWIARGSTKIGAGASSGSRIGVGNRHISLNVESSGSICMAHLDSPSTTSPTTYNVYIASEDSGDTAYLNRTANDTNNDSYGARGSSSITVFEVLG